MTHDQPHPAQLLSADAAAEFALAGNATLTLVSTKTGARYTYQIRGKEDRDCKKANFDIWFVSVLYGPDNESDFTYLGFIKPDELRYAHGKKSKVSVHDQRAAAFIYFWDAIIKARRIPAKLEIWHEGRCGRCARKLTVPESIARGLGPECLTKIGA